MIGHLCVSWPIACALGDTSFYLVLLTRVRSFSGFITRNCRFLVPRSYPGPKARAAGLLAAGGRRGGSPIFASTGWPIAAIKVGPLWTWQACAPQTGCFSGEHGETWGQTAGGTSVGRRRCDHVCLRGKRRGTPFDPESPHPPRTQPGPVPPVLSPNPSHCLSSQPGPECV